METKKVIKNALDPAILRHFVHDAINSIRPIVDQLVLVEYFPERPLWLQDSEVRRSTIRNLRAYMQALQNVRALAQCEQFQKNELEVVDWKELVGEHTSKLLANKKLTFQMDFMGSDFKGQADPTLIPQVLENLTWFATHYTNQLKSVALKSIQYDGKKAIQLIYVVETILDLGPEFEQCEPFFCMTEPKGPDFSQTTGLLFFVIQKIAALHEGTFIIKSHKKTTSLEFMCPLVESFSF